MSARTLIGGTAAALIGVFIFLLVQNSTVSSTGVHLTVVPKKAAAACTKATLDCKPKLTFVDTNGEAYPPEALAGKVVVVNFWATWCHPCQQEIPAFSRVFVKYQNKDLVMLGVMTDNPDPAKLLNFQSDYELLYPVVRADRDILLQFEYPEAIPTTFVYDRTGALRLNHRGPLSEDELSTLVDQLLAEK